MQGGAQTIGNSPSIYQVFTYFFQLEGCGWKRDVKEDVNTCVKCERNSGCCWMRFLCRAANSSRLLLNASICLVSYSQTQMTNGLGMGIHGYSWVEGCVKRESMMLQHKQPALACVCVHIFTCYLCELIARHFRSLLLEFCLVNTRLLIDYD